MSLNGHWMTLTALKPTIGHINDENDIFYTNVIIQNIIKYILSKTKDQEDQIINDKTINDKTRQQKDAQRQMIVQTTVSCKTHEH